MQPQAWRAQLRYSLRLDEDGTYLNPELTFTGWEPSELYFGIHYYELMILEHQKLLAESALREKEKLRRLQAENAYGHSGELVYIENGNSLTQIEQLRMRAGHGQHVAVLVYLHHRFG